jgi:hypothetical protein
MYKKRMGEVNTKEYKEIGKVNPRVTLVLKLIFYPLELVSFCLQYFYMRSKITNEKVGFKKAFFHPADLTIKIYRNWVMELSKFGYNEDWSRKIFFG